MQRDTEHGEGRDPARSVQCRIPCAENSTWQAAGAPRYFFFFWWNEVLIRNFGNLKSSQYLQSTLQEKWHLPSKWALKNKDFWCLGRDLRTLEYYKTANTMTLVQQTFCAYFKCSPHSFIFSFPEGRVIFPTSKSQRDARNASALCTPACCLQEPMLNILANYRHADVLFSLMQKIHKVAWTSVILRPVAEHPICIRWTWAKWWRDRQKSEQ